MPWVRFDDHYLQSKKLRAAGRDAVWLHFAGVFWSARIDNLFDGRIEKTGQAFEDFAAHAMLKPPQLKKLAAVLVDNGRWEDHGDHWLIHDYHDYQPTRSEVEEMREKRSAAGKRGADVRHGKSHGKRLGKSDGNGLDESLAPSPESRIGTTNNNSSRLATGPPVDNCKGDDDPVDAVLEAIVQRLVELHEPTHPQNYAASVWQTVPDEFGLKAANAVERYPGAPSNSIAALLLGEPAPTLAHYRRTESA